jgi:type III restriction enzyme
MEDPEVIAKRDIAVIWCANASEYTASYGGKPWRYLPVPHGAAVQSATLPYLAQRHAQAAAPGGHQPHNVVT